MTNKRKIYISAFDLQRLQDFLDDMDPAERKKVRALEDELQRAMVLPPEKIPAEVVTMNSRVRYRDLEDDTEMEITLVFPGDADISQGKMSVLSPIGTAMLGYKAGEELEWRVPDGFRKIRIEALTYQPESSGDFHL
ncbi:MAG: nucleoside diphosphate kinase regulator [Verrucomicrobia bacterium]|nr:nucleoside diphosphate kinase regulator [Verrucomicrobiota bacterium]MCH8512689.1 nucleoside diphosphate kinase regulator [Kiritimatiellia bacterium]